MNFVFTLSNGREMSETLKPEIADEVNLMVTVYVFDPVNSSNFSFASL